MPVPLVCHILNETVVIICCRRWGACCTSYASSSCHLRRARWPFRVGTSPFQTRHATPNNYTHLYVSQTYHSKQLHALIRKSDLLLQTTTPTYTQVRLITPNNYTHLYVSQTYHSKQLHALIRKSDLSLQTTTRTYT